MDSSKDAHKAKIFLVCGLAGSGKTTFIAKSRDYLQGLGKRVYVVNLDPAVVNLYYPVNLDIRDNVDFSSLCRDKNIGPNGAILTSLNLFFSKIDQFMQIMERKVATHDYILIDSPGQIEFLLWSASGDVLCDNLVKLQKFTKLLYVIDKSKCIGTQSSFLPSNILLYSGLYDRTRHLEHAIVFNKDDIPIATKQNAVRNEQNGYRKELDTEILDSFGDIFSKTERHFVSSVSGDGFYFLEKSNIKKLKQMGNRVTE